MNTRDDIREFLTSRRARITPEQAGLPAYGGGKRRVSGLRREEVALLAGISVEYYTRLERGNAGGVSESDLEGIARALQLDEAECAHLIDLVRTNATRPARRRATQQRVRPSVQRILDLMTGTPAFVRNGCLDVARAFGATDILAERGEGANEAVLELTGGVGVDAALECVGTGQSVATAFAIARPGSTVGIVGVPHGVDVPFTDVFFRSIGWHGGPAPARVYIPELLDDVLEGRIMPGRVFDYETDLDGIADAYAAMDERRAIKSLVRVGSL